jgi:hypothetical protein
VLMATSCNGDDYNVVKTKQMEVHKYGKAV